MRRIQPRSSAVLSENRSGAAGNFTVRRRAAMPAVVYHYQHPNTEKFSGKKCYSVIWIKTAALRVCWK